MIRSCRKKKHPAKLTSLLDAMLMHSNVVATICTTNVYMVPHINNASIFYSTTPLFPSEKVQDLPVHWRGPYQTLKCLNDVNYQIKEVSTVKDQVVYYHRMKRYHGPITVVSNVRTRPTTQTTGYQTHSVPDFDHSQCGQTFTLYHLAPHLTSPATGNRPSFRPTSAPTKDNFPNLSPSVTPPPLLSSARQCSLPSLTRSIDHERRTTPPVSLEPRSSSSPRKLQSSCPSPKKTNFVQSPSRLDSLIYDASHNLRQRLYSSPQSNSPATLRTSLNKSFDMHATPSKKISTTSRSLRSAIKQQRHAQPLFKAKLP